MNSGDKASLIGILGALLIVGVVVSSLLMTVIISDATTRDELPRCREEQVLEGFGRFSHGYWDEYTCVSLPD
jgi:hypothetical protein